MVKAADHEGYNYYDFYTQPFACRVLKVTVESLAD